MASGEARPLLRVVRGDASAEETAALVAALALAQATSRRAAAAAEATAAAAQRRHGALRPGWCDRARLLDAPIAHGPGAWRASALPR